VTWIQWLLRIALACLAFAIVWYGLPWLLQFIFHISWPDPLVGLIALVAFLAVLSHYWWGRTVVPSA